MAGIGWSGSGSVQNDGGGQHKSGSDRKREQGAGASTQGFFWSLTDMEET